MHIFQRVKSKVLAYGRLFGHIVSAADLDLQHTLTNQIKALTQKNNAQLVVLVVETTGDETIEQYATRVFDSWKPGDKDRDDGVLLLVAWQDNTVVLKLVTDWKVLLRMRSPGKLFATVLFRHLKKAT